MEPITNLIGLKTRIAELELQREADKEEIKLEVSGFLESLKPANLIGRIFKSVKESPDLKNDLMHGAMGLATGFITNRLFLGSAKGPLKKILAWVVQSGMTSAAIKYPEEIKEKGISWLTRFLQSIKIKTDDGIESQHASGSSQL